MVPDEVVHYFKNKKISRVVCCIEDNLEFQCALMPAGSGTYFINVNKEIRRKSRWQIGESRDIALFEDESTYGLIMPEELREVLRTDSEGDEFFHALTAGKQRNLIYIASKPKTPSIRLKKSIIMIDYLKESGGKLDFKELNQAFKDRAQEF